MTGKLPCLLHDDHPLVLAERGWALAGMAGVSDVAWDCQTMGDQRCRFVQDDPATQQVEVRPFSRSDPVLVYFSADYGRVPSRSYRPCEWFDTRAMS